MLPVLNTRGFPIVRASVNNQAILDKFQASPSDMGTSILMDREAGQPLEWDIRNGVVLRRGRRHGIPTPISDVIVPLLAAASDGPG
ncbi:ketopantoate reductase C-terminal domain-containing protein [Asaia sp. As-1742]|uniref:ketopantoate reductase C-terminal domain-containing protein n=1 Tax=Asaia sp. As-1742 TaxID=2608325 RepID=UPI00351A9595